MSVKAATANIVGIEDKKVAQVGTEVKGPEVNVAQFNAVGRKTGASVNATAEATMGELQAGTACDFNRDGQLNQWLSTVEI